MKDLIETYQKEECFQFSTAPIVVPLNIKSLHTVNLVKRVSMNMYKHGSMDLPIILVGFDKLLYHR